MNKITEEIIKEDIHKIMPPVSLRIFAYGFVLSGLLFALAIYMNSNAKYKSEFWFWLPLEFIVSVILFGIISFVFEKAYRKIIKDQKVDNLKLKNENSELRREIMKITGKKVVVKIGGEPPQKDPNEIVGSETIVHVPDSEIGKYQNITGEKIEVTIGKGEKK